jgi:hypothetical protein
MSHANLSRRTLVATAAALPALAVPAPANASTEPDPIIAIIETHRAALAAVEDHGSAIDADEYAPGAQEEHERLEEIEEEAFGVLIETEPTTLRGAATLLRYVAKLERRGEAREYEIIGPREKYASQRARASFFVKINVAEALESMSAAVQS